MPHDKRFKKNKISPLVSSQLPEFVQSDYDIFSSFVRDYYKFLEAGRISYEVDPEYLTLELNSSAYVLQESVLEEDYRFVTENVVQFVPNETVVGSESKAVATVLFDDIRTQVIYVTSQQGFITGETITGATSGLSATLLEYRANPVQNIQQMLEYADVDNTIYDFLDQFKESFLSVIPNTYVSSASKRLLVKTIKDLYAAKGTPEATKLFLRILLDEDADIRYPIEDVLKVSGGNLERKTVLRCSSISGSDGRESEGQVITGFTSNAIATVSKANLFPEGTASVIEILVENQVGEFITGEIISCTSNITDRTIKFTVGGIIAGGEVTNSGLLYSFAEPTTIETGKGNEFGSLIYDSVDSGSISSIFVDDGGTGYNVGESLYFTNPTDDLVTAEGFVAALGGGFELEDGEGVIVREVSTTQTESPFNIALEQNEEYTGPFYVFGTAEADGQRGGGTRGYFYPLYTNLTDAGGELVDGVLVGAHVHTFLEYPNTTFYMNSSLSNHGLKTLPIDETSIAWPRRDLDKLVLDGTDGSGSNENGLIPTELGERQISLDLFYGINDQILLEEGTLPSSDASAIYKVHLKSNGSGYTSLPTVSVKSTDGAGAKLLALTNDIGRANSVTVNTFGFSYDPNDPPEINARAHFILKDVTGTFSAGNLLTSHTGQVVGWDGAKNQLDVTFDDSILFQQEQEGTFNLPFILEDGTHGGAEVLSGNKTLLEETILNENLNETDNIVLDGTSISETPSRFVRISVKALISSANPLLKRFYLNGVEQKEFVIEPNNTYYFDLSDPSLFNTSSSLQYRFQLTSTNTDSGEYTTGVTTSDQTVSETTGLLIKPGESGAFLKLVTTDATPDLYYYSPNYSDIGGRLRTSTPPAQIRDVGFDLLLDNTLETLDLFVLEDGVGSPNGNILIEQGFGRLVEETSIVDSNGNGFTQDVGGKVDLDSSAEVQVGTQFELILEDGGSILQETFGNYLALDNTDSAGTDNGSRILSEEDLTGDGFLVLDGTDADTNNSGKFLINETNINFLNDDVVITDAGGASGTIILGDIAKITASVSTVSDPIDAYRGVSSLLSEDTIRIQDSYFYQQFSYEVRVGESTSNYLNELKKAVHPIGFAPFGRVTVATQISAALRTTRSLSDEVRGQESFSPFLASVLEQIFDEVVRRRHAVVPEQYVSGHYHDFVTQETGNVLGDTIVLDGTDITLANSGDNLITEDDLDISLEDGLTIFGTEFILYETGDTTNASDPAGGRALLESSSVGLGLNKELAVIKTVSIVTASEANEKPKNLLSKLASNAFSGAGSSILLEDTDGNGYSDGYLVMDGFDPILPIAFIVQEEDGESYFLLENENGVLQVEAPLFRFGEVGVDGSGEVIPNAFYVLGQNDKLNLEDAGNEFDLTFAEVGTITFGEISRPSAFLLEQPAAIPELQYLNKIELEQDDVTFIQLELGAIGGSATLFSTGNLGVGGETILNAAITTNSTIDSPLNFFGTQVNFDLNADSGSSGAVSGRSSTLTDVFDLRDLSGTFRHIDLVTPVGYETGQTPISPSGFLELEEGDVEENLNLYAGQQDINQAFANDVDIIVLEDNGVIILDGSAEGVDVGDYLLNENSKRVQLEISGNLIFENFSALNYGQLQLEDGSGYLRSETPLVRDPKDGIALEEGVEDFEDSRIVLNGTNASGTDVNDIVLQEQEILDREFINDHFLLEDTLIFATDGQIPWDNVSINKDSDIPTRVKKLAGQPVIRGADITIIG